MHEKYFYINTSYEELFPPYSEENIKRISFNDINYLALIAAGLEAYPSITEIGGKVEALQGYFINHKDERLKEIYDILTSNEGGRRILVASTALAVYEQDFKVNGIVDPEKIIAYNGWVVERTKIINVNKGFFSEEFIRNK